jgi:peptidoglycan/xylan/chitin deacetylase (PgdA/CDA1 family)
MRGVIAASFLVASLVGMGAAQAAECPGNPNALGTSRTIVLDPAEHPRLGTLQYDESLPLNDHEVVLTFDDGPLPPYTSRVLDTLAAECVKATFFLVGKMALGYPKVVLREYNEGHTIGGHSQDHPFTFAKMSVDQAAKEIEDGFDSVRTVLGDPKAVAPFFRIPGLLRQKPVEDYLASHGYATWSLDFLADDWTHISAQEIIRRALERIEARGRGILLLHDIQPATALALPTLLAELKARGYKIVQVVPSTPDRPATVAQTDWVQRHHTRPSWPRVLALGSDKVTPSLDVPSPQNFGVAYPPGKVGAVDLVAGAGGESPLRQSPSWPTQANYGMPVDNEVLPIPAAQDFIYVLIRPMSVPRALGDSKALPKKLAAVLRPTIKPVPASKTPSVSRPAGPAAARPRTIGHQLNFSKPTATL